ncbi:MAG: glycoside hydrolase family 88 protein [Lachnospiraceae bacterium]
MKYSTNHEYKDWATERFNRVQTKMEAVRERSAEKIPSMAIEGVHDDMKCLMDESGNFNRGISYWTNGFWAGINWLMYSQIKNERYREIAQFSEEKLDEALYNYYRITHDAGFIWLPTAVANFRFTDSDESRKRGLTAAALLKSRFNPVGKYFRAWNDSPFKDKAPAMNMPGVTIIDCLMNLPLLYWASEELGDPSFKQAAMMHADTTIENFIREDGSVRHIVEFDPETGKFVKDYAGQGYAPTSAWTRGQAWGLYGFTISHRRTGESRYLDAAIRVADHFIANIPESGLIPCDFHQPADSILQDDIAAAAASSGLIELFHYAPHDKKQAYWDAAIKMLKSLDEKSSDYNPSTDGILQNCTAAYHMLKQNLNILYGDYYYIEALLKLIGNNTFLW